MLVTFMHQNRYGTVQAPLGAGAFAVYSSPSEPAILHVVFAMMIPADKNAAQTLARVTQTPTTLQWFPTTARPEFYKAPYYSKSQYVEYVFQETNGVWLPTTPVLANYLVAMQLAQNMPAQPPETLEADMTQYANANG